MNAAHLAVVFLAEVDRLFRRPVAIAGLVLSLFFGLGSPILLAVINSFILEPAITFSQQGGAPPPGEGGPEYISWGYSVYMAYYGRNFLFVPILIFLLSGLSMASEFVARTVREDVVRPIHRWQLFMAKWAALATWIVALSLVLCLSSTVGGLVLLGGFAFDQDALTGIEGATAWGQMTAYMSYVWNPVAEPIQSAATTFMTDLGFATLALSIAVLTRSVAATVASMVMLFVLQLALALGLAVATSPIAEQAVAYQAPWMDTASVEAAFAWARWVQTWQPPFVIGNCASVGIPSWESFATLGVITLFAVAVGIFRFETMDVP
jgi:ABC-type transport system involved in multi-copper enzyme maturation permease subunit